MPISASLTQTNKDDIKINVDDIKLILSFLVNITPKERKKFYKMGQKSVGFIKGVLSVMRMHPSAVPAAFSLAEFEKDYQLYIDMRGVLDLMLPLMEGIEDTLFVLKSELMRQGALGYKLIKQASRTNLALDNAVKELGARFKRGSRAQAEIFSLNPLESLTLQGVVPKRLFKTLNQSSVILYRGESATGKSKTVDGKSKILIPVGWYTMTIFNKDEKKPAIFSLIQKGGQPVFFTPQ